MRKFFQRMWMALQKFMYGRYGNDALNKTMLIAALVLLLLAYFPYLQWLYFLAWALLIFANVRCFSRNIPRRQREWQQYQRLLYTIKSGINRTRSRFRERHTHRYFRCRHCKAWLRVPKGRGTVDVKCPRCRQITTRHT